MSLARESLAAERLASLARAGVESRRRLSPKLDTLGETCARLFGELDAERRAAVADELIHLTPERDKTRDQAPLPAARLGVDGSAAEVMKQRAGLELRLKTLEQQKSEIEQALHKEQRDHREAVETLLLQQAKLTELREERTKLLADVSRLESKLRLQIGETEQEKLKHDKLKASRRTVGDQAAEQTEQITALGNENERLKTELAAALKERDRDVASADVAVSRAEHGRAQSAFQRLWRRMRVEVPEVFVETIVPDERTFELLCDALVEFLRTQAVLELHVHHLLRDLRQVSDKSDKLNHFYIMFTKNPGLLEALTEYLVSGKRKGNFANLLRAHQAWTRAFASGPYKVIVRSPSTIADELNYKSWPLKTGFTKTEDAAIGEYFKQTAQKTIPEKLGTAFRKQAAEMAYEDYNDLMKRK